MSTGLNEALLQHAQELLPWLTEVRRDFHRYPEFGMEEFRTQEKISAYLNELGIPHEKVAGTGIVGIIEGAHPGGVVGLRGDMDALPIFEENAVEYRSQIAGRMHACGHDAHMTCLLGAARLLVAQKQQLGTDKVKVNELPSLGVEDFAFFAEHVPSAFYHLGVRNEQAGLVYPVHHPRFDLDERSLMIGAAMQACNALTFLQKQAAQGQAK